MRHTCFTVDGTFLYINSYSEFFQSTVEYNLFLALIPHARFSLVPCSVCWAVVWFCVQNALTLFPCCYFVLVFFFSSGSLFFVCYSFNKQEDGSIFFYTSHHHQKSERWTSPNSHLCQLQMGQCCRGCAELRQGFVGYNSSIRCHFLSDTWQR
jgi:hypothetical protein